MTGNNVTKKGCGDVGATLEVIFIMVVAPIRHCGLGIVRAYGKPLYGQTRYVANGRMRFAPTGYTNFKTFERFGIATRIDLA